jgi:hypothetical protein
MDCIRQEAHKWFVIAWCDGHFIRMADKEGHPMDIYPAVDPAQKFHIEYIHYIILYL